MKTLCRPRGKRAHWGRMARVLGGGGYTPLAARVAIKEPEARGLAVVVVIVGDRHRESLYRKVALSAMAGEVRIHKMALTEIRCCRSC